MYYQSRYYDPAIGRFITPDTIVPDPFNAQAYNRYMYVLGNPIKHNDPTGHEPCEGGYYCINVDTEGNDDPQVLPPSVDDGGGGGDGPSYDDYCSLYPGDDYCSGGDDDWEEPVFLPGDDDNDDDKGNKNKGNNSEEGDVNFHPEETIVEEPISPPAPKIPSPKQVQPYLDVMGMVPFIGEAADIASAIISVYDGDTAGALLSVGAAIPGIGNAFGGIKATKGVGNIKDVVVRRTRGNLPGARITRADGSILDITPRRVKEFVPNPHPSAPPGTLQKVKFKDALPKSKGFKRAPTSEELNFLDSLFP